jgi:hypothetical protein
MKHLVACVVGSILLSPSALGQTLRCPDPGAGAQNRAREKFVLPFNAGTAALSEGRYQDAVSLADAAAPNAMDALQLQSALKIRSTALLASRDDAQLIPTLELRIKVGCHIRSGEAEELSEQLEAARARAISRPE